MSIPLVTLNNGVRIPQLGLGTARVEDEEIRRIVGTALGLGYRLIDTAAKYENELGVGQGIADAGLARTDLFVTSKLRGRDQGFASTKVALAQTLERLGLDHLDLYLIHWPLPRSVRQYSAALCETESASIHDRATAGQRTGFKLRCPECLVGFLHIEPQSGAR